MTGESYAVQYLTAILDGKIVACDKMKLLADMMLPRFEGGYKDWHFDIKCATRPIEFIERFCYMPSGRIGVPFVLELFEKAWLEMAFGFVDDNLLRQFHEVLTEVARKNGKTSLVAAVELFMLMGDGEGAPQIYNVANSKDQASLAYGAVLRMMRQSKTLSKRLRKGIVPDRNSDGIMYPPNMGYITPLTSQTRNLDGLDVHFGVFDEMSAYVNRDLYDLVRQGISAREQPLLWAITSNGFQRGGIFDDRVEYGTRILKGEVDDDRFLPIMYELDRREEWVDETCWVKANPGLGTVKKLSALQDIVTEAQQNPGLVPTVLTKDFNVAENKATAWLSFEEAVNTEPFPELPESGKLSDIGFRYGIAGFDASDTTDLSAAKMLMMRPGDDKIYEMSMYWLPEDSLRNDGLRTERDDVPFRQWIDRGLMRLVPGNKVPKTVFLEWLDELKMDYDVWTFAIGYDPWRVVGTDELMFQQYVGKNLCEVVRQGPKTFSDPMKQMKADFAAKRYVNGHNPIDEWCRMNVSIKTDVNANIQPVKAEGQAKHRIDGYMAELDAYIAFLRHREEYLALI